MEIERGLGFEPTDREFEKLGYDIESRVPHTGTRNEILYSLNKPDDFILAIVEFLDDDGHNVHYTRRPFQREPDFNVVSVNYSLADLLARAEAPK